jgi:hypothetical protein
MESRLDRRVKNRDSGVTRESDLATYPELFWESLRQGPVPSGRVLEACPDSFE